METITINNQEHRVEVNWNAITQLCEMKGITDLSAIGGISKLTAEEVGKFIYICLVQGSLLNKETFPYSQEEIGLHLSLPAIMKFMDIFKSQTSPGIENKTTSKKKKKRWFRSLSRS